jgi:hypothetical protein
MQRPLAVGLKELIWRKGDERCERSYKPAHGTLEKESEAQGIREQESAKQESAKQESAKQESAKQESAKQAQLLMPLTPDGFRQVSTKREEASMKINERYLVGQATQNPFMSANNYVNDIEVQMNFLTPQKSS